MTTIGGYRRLLAATIASAGIFLANGCVAVELDELERGEAQIQSQNGMGYNGMGYNGMGYNGLDYNGLNQNGMGYNALGYNGMGYSGTNYKGLNHAALVGNEMWKSWMTNPEYTDQPGVFDYIVRCALAAGQVIDRIEIDGGVYGPWEGSLGVAAAWYEEGNDVQTEAEQERVSACLMAHVNAVGVHVPISVLGDSLAPPSPEESEKFWAFEGQFFGNVLNDTPSKSVCLATGEANAATIEQLYEIDRLCAADPSLCAFARAPKCSDACDGWDEERGIYTECEGYKAVGVYVAP